MTDDIWNTEKKTSFQQSWNLTFKYILAKRLASLYIARYDPGSVEFMVGDFAMLNNKDNNAPIHWLTTPNGNTDSSQIIKIDI